MKILKQHPFSAIALFFCLLTVFAWWRSTKIWTAHHVQTPYGFLHAYSESSLFVIETEYTIHDNRWTAYSNADPIKGDSMRFLAQFPKVTLSRDYSAILLPYWQIASAFIALAVLLYFWTIRRKRRHLTSPDPPSPEVFSKTPELRTEPEDFAESVD